MGVGADLGVRLLVIGVVIVSHLSEAYRGQSRVDTVKRRGETQMFGTMRSASAKMLQIAPNCQPTALWSEGFSSICRVNTTVAAWFADFVSALTRANIGYVPLQRCVDSR